MRWALPLLAAFLVSGCNGVSDYTPDTGSRSSYMGNQGGAGVQASIWSDDPNKGTLTNQKPSQ